MAKKIEIQCAECDQIEKFIDKHDIKSAKWQLIAYSVDKNIPICICPKCNYGDYKKKMIKKG